MTNNDAIAGFLTDLLSKASFGAGDEILAGGNAALDSVFGGPGYDARLQQARELQKNFQQDHPAISFLDNAPALLAPGPAAFSKAKGLVPAITNILKGAAIGSGYGAASGFLGGEGGLENRGLSAAQGALGGLEAGGALQTLGESLQGAGNVAGNWARSLDRKSLGTRASDYADTINKGRTAATPQGDLESLTKKTLDDLLSSNALGTTRDPSKLLAALKDKKKTLGNQIGSLIDAWDQANPGGATPTWARSLDYLTNDPKLPAERQADLFAKLADINDAIKSQGGGKLSYLQGQKISKGGFWDKNDSEMNNLMRNVYLDLKDTIEQKVPDVGGLNQELQKYMIAEPIIKRGTAAAENASPEIKSAMRTSGGVGTLLIGGLTGTAATGNPLYGALGLGAVGAQKFANSRTGQKLESDALDLAAPALRGAGNGAGDLIAPISEAVGLPNQESQTQPELPQEQKLTQPESLSNFQKFAAGVSSQASPDNSTDAPLSNFQKFLQQSSLNGAPMADTTQDNSTVPAKLVDTMIRWESGSKKHPEGNPDAVSPKGAQGLMQIEPDTFAEEAGKLGLPKDADPFDPDINKQVGTAYIGGLLKKYKGDVPTALAAYNWGLGHVDKAHTALDSTDFKDLSSVLPDETQNYVKNIMADYEA